jgi:tetratricopeptide (TPR) repeat protein
LKKLFVLVLTSLSLLVACKSKQQQSSTSSADYAKAISIWVAKPDSAFYYFNRVASTSHDSLQIARAYNCMAQIQSETGDHYGAQESLVQSLHFLHEDRQEDQRCLTSSYNELGITSNNLHDYNIAVQYFDKALQFDHEHNFKINILNNKANAYRKNSNYMQALSLYREIKRLIKPKSTAYAQLLTNLVITKWRQNYQFNPVPELIQALQIRNKEKDIIGVNSSYAHLTDYYLTQRPDSALSYADKWYMQAQKIHSPEDELSALTTLIKLKPVKDIRRYFTLYKNINDSLQLLAGIERNTSFGLFVIRAEGLPLIKIR